MGALEDQVYFLYDAGNSGDHKIAAVQEGTSELAIVNTIPADRMPLENWFNWNGRLYWGLNNTTNTSENILYAFDGNVFTALENPTDASYEEFTFTYQEKVYLLYRNGNNERVLYQLKDDFTIATAHPIVATNTSLQVFPNPITSDFQVQFNVKERVDVTSFVLSSALGQVIQTQRAVSVGETYQAHFFTTQLPKGIYFITAITSWGLLTKRLVKE